MSTRLNDCIIVGLWCENEGYHHIKDPWTLANSVVEKLKVCPHTMSFSLNSEARSS